MLLDRALQVISLLAWIALAVFVSVYVIRTTQRAGIHVAVRRLLSWRMLIVFLLVVGITLLSEALVFIQPQEVGVVVSLVEAQGYRDRPLRSGLRWIVPFFEEVQRYPIYFQTYTMAARPTEGRELGNDAITARTSDGQEVVLDTSVIFQIDPEQAIRIHIEWQTRYIDDFIRPVLRGIIRTQVSQYTVNEVNSSKRLDLERDLSDQVRAVLEDKGFVMDRFLLRNITFSEEYAATVEQKQVAQQQAIQKEYEAEQIRKLASGEADRIRTVASAEAEAVLVKAQAEADALKLLGASLAQRPDLITYRYIDKLAPSIRVMLVPSNAPYLLPLPSLDANIEPATSFTPVLTVPSPNALQPPETIPGQVFTPTLSITPTPTPGG